MRLGRREVPLLSGALHYWRLERDAWKPALREVRNLGLPLVETYVPWSVHEVGPNAFDFGERDPRLDLGAFLDLAGELGMQVFLRPGPHINAEMTHFGIPKRVIDDPACQARSPRGNPVVLGFPPRMFPVPSYASDAFHGEVGRWYDAVGAVVRDRMWPHGPIVLLQVDNEAAYYFRNGPFDQDYHPDALARWREFLERHHGSLEALNAAHGSAHERWAEVMPPRRFEAAGPRDLVPQLDWAAFKEVLIEEALGRMRDRMAEAGMGGVPVVHNLPLGDGGLDVSLPGIGRVVDLAGLDYYHPAREYHTVKRRTLYLAGTAAVPYAPELGVGAPPWFTPLSNEDSLFTAMAACAFGLRGFNLYMAVDRDRWYGAPIDGSGTPRVEAGTWKHFVHALTDARFHDLRREVEVAVLWPREYARLSRATHALGPLSPSTLEALGGAPVDGCRGQSFGLDGPVQVRWWAAVTTVAAALAEAGIPHVFVDSDAPEAQLAGMRVVISPMHAFVDRGRWMRLEALAAEGVEVVYGPGHPELDGRMDTQRFHVPPRMARHALDDPDAARALVRDLGSRLDLRRPFPVSPPPLETTVHGDGSGPQLLFVLNPAARALEARIEPNEPVTLTDLMHGNQFEGEQGVTIPMEPRTVRMLRIEREATGSAARADVGGGQTA
ncbi:MAG: beta-galactosidase [Myxococcota bacterium]